jgi:histone deacetylase 11
MSKENNNDKLPIVYSKSYDIGVQGMEKLHPFDLRKYSNVFNELVRRGLIKPDQVVKPEKVSEKDLAAVHSAEYLKTWKDRKALASIFEVPAVGKMPAFVTRRLVIDPMLHQTGGSIAAAELALRHGWAINLGGGFHHASAERGHGFCLVADITIAIKKLRETHPEIKKIMIVDLDAHQGDGYERDFYKDPDVFIVDFYNKYTFPMDISARQRINIGEGLKPGTKDQDYLAKLADALKKAPTAFKPDVIFYVAGTDILTGDPVGQLSVSAAGVIQRDEMVFDHALTAKIPIVMLFGGGYLKSNAGMIADSIENLDKKFGLLKKNTPQP